MPVVKLDAHDPKTLTFGGVEQMFGGTGYKASFNPKVEVRMPSMRVPWKVTPQHLYVTASGAGVTWSCTRVGIDGYAEAAGPDTRFDFG